MEKFVIMALVTAIAFSQDRSNCNKGVESFCSRKGKSATACNPQRCSVLKSDHRSDLNFKASMIERHNYYRSQPYTGQGGPVSGADIVEVTWDNELEMNALIWANALCQRTKGTDNVSLDHDDCRESPSYDFVGQSVAWGAGGSWDAPIDVDAKAVRGWNVENASVPSSLTLTGSFPGAYLNGEAIGHYTQLMWSRSFRIGCAYVTSTSPKYKVQGWVVCDYGVGGNYLGQKVFTAGRLGSKCMAGSVPGGTYGLCRVDDVATFRKTVGVQNAS